VRIVVEPKILLSLEVTEKNTSDSEVLLPLLKDVNFEDTLVDDAYDTNDAFGFMKSDGANCPGIKIRGNKLRKQLDAMKLKVKKGIMQGASFITSDPGHVKNDTPHEAIP
jgi:argonaute-like protein implicated in RNA metabolism and viral defense